MKNIILTSIIGLCFLFANTLNAQWIKTNGPQGGTISCIARVQDKIWAGTRNGIYSSADEGATWKNLHFMEGNSIAGLYYSGDTIVMIYDSLLIEESTSAFGTRSQTSFDGGVSWTSPASIPIFSQYPIDIARVQNTIILNNSKISRDFGLTWTDFVGPLNNTYMPWVLTNDSVVIAAIINNYSSYTSFYRSTDAMNSWQCIDSSQTYDGWAYLSGNTLLITKDNHLLRSTDYGTSFHPVFNMPGQYASPSFGRRNGLLYLAVNIDTTVIYYKSADDGLTWQPSSSMFYALLQPLPLSNGDILSLDYSSIVRNLAGSTVQIPSVTGIATNTITSIHSNKNVLFAGTYNNLLRSSDGGISWYASSQKLAAVSDMEFFGDTIFAAGQDSFYCSYNNGLTWVAQWGDYTMDGYTLTKVGSSLFVGEIYSAVKYTQDFGLTWQDMSSLTNSSFSFGGGNVEVINDSLYAVSNDGYVFRYDFANNNWIQLLEFWSPGAHNRNILYALDTVLVMAGQDEFLTSHDYGITWVESPLMGMPFQITFFGDSDILAYPRNVSLHQGMWLASCGNYGVYKSIDEGLSWQPLDPSPTSFAALNGFAVVNDILYAGTAWNSVWRRTAPFNSIEGHVFIDLNNNGLWDIGESPMAGGIVYLQTLGHTATTDIAGYYNLLTDAIGDTLRIVLPNAFFTSSPGHYITAGADTGRNFGLYAPPSIVDLSIELTNANVFRPNFTTYLVLEAHNNSMSTQSPTVSLVLDPGISYGSASPAPTTTNGDTLIWNLGSMDFNESRHITITAATLNTVALGAAVKSYAFITPIAGDTIPENNAAILIDTVVGSYDPNDKQCSLGKTISPEQVREGKEVVFTVRFQNTGNYQADFVRIADTISHFFDLTSFKVLSSSHTMHWNMQGPGIVNFYFDSILLPPSSDDEPGSHGFVKYSVKCKQSASLGDAITNTAFIYFDFNAPIVTNTTTTIVAEPLKATGIPNVIWAKDLAIKVYPNPAWNTLNIDLSELDGTEKQIAIYSIAGELVYKTSTTELLSTVSIQNFNSGMYFGTVNNNGTIGKFKFIVEH